MPNVYEHHVTAGSVRLVRRFVVEGDVHLRPGNGTGARRIVEADRTTWTRRSRANMRYEFSGLPWSMLDRPVLITLTMPGGDWRKIVPDARALVAKREQFKEAWRKRWGPPIGAWVVEFQERATAPKAHQRAPHFHLYLNLPEQVTAQEYRRLQVRVQNRKRREREYGRFDGRRMTGPPNLGEFGVWLLATWHEVLGKPAGAHALMGADITTAFWDEEAEARLTTAGLGEYFWRESGKMGQKSAPEWFGGLRFWGVWGRARGFVVVGGFRNVDKLVYCVIRRQYVRMFAEQARQMYERRVREARMNGEPPPPRYYRPSHSRGLDGVTLYLRDGIAVGSRMQAWAERLVWDRLADEARERSELNDFFSG